MFSFHWLTKIKMAAILVAKMDVKMAANSTTILCSFWTTWQIYLKFGRYVYHNYDHTNTPFVDSQKFKMAAILDVKMAANMANSTKIPWNFCTAGEILLIFGRYVYYMILYMFYLLGYKNSRWPPSLLPIWPPLQLQNPITCEPLDQLCSNYVDMSTIWSYICSICWFTKIQDGRHHGCQYGGH